MRILAIAQAHSGSQPISRSDRRLDAIVRLHLNLPNAFGDGRFYSQ